MKPEAAAADASPAERYAAEPFLAGEAGEPFFRSLVEQLGRALHADTVIVGEKLGDDRVRTLATLRETSMVPNISDALAGAPSESIFARPDPAFYSDRVAEVFPRDLVLAREAMRGYIGLSPRDPKGAAIGVLGEIHADTNMVDRQGGSGSAQAEPGHGATFSFRLDNAPALNSDP